MCVCVCVVTKPCHLWSVKPAMTQSTYKKLSQVSLCDDKNCQSTKSLCNEWNCQSTRCVHMWPVKPAVPQSSCKMNSSTKSQVKSEVTQSTQFQSVSKAARKQIGTQPAVTRNCQDSTSKQWYPLVSTCLYPDLVKMQSNHI